MTKPKRTAMITVGVAAMAVVAVVVNNPKSNQVENPKPGYVVERQSDSQFSVYETGKGKNKRLLGKDLTSDQADQFLNKKIGRHNQ